MNAYSFEDGSTRTWLIVAITFIVTTLAATGVMIWALLNYFDQKENVDAKIDTAVTAAVKQQADADAARFEAEEKLPHREFVGPDDYGELRFNYPKTWSVYVDKDASSGSVYQAYLNPVAVPPISSSQQYALRVTIETKDYDQVIKGFETAVRRGDLKSSAASINGETGTRFDGTFSKDIRGSAVVFKIRDKTVTLRTDADTFRADFDALVASIKFNQ